MEYYEYYEENYEHLINKRERKKMKKMPKPIEERYRGRKLNQRTKKKKAKEL